MNCTTDSNYTLLQIVRERETEREDVCVCERACMRVCVRAHLCGCVCMWVEVCCEHSYATGWRRLIRSPKLQIIFHKRATKYRSLWQKMIYTDKGSYESSPPCMNADLYVC